MHRKFGDGGCGDGDEYDKRTDTLADAMYFPPCCVGHAYLSDDTVALRPL